MNSAASDPIASAVRDISRLSKIIPGHHWTLEHFKPFVGDMPLEFGPTYLGTRVRGSEFGAWSGQRGQTQIAASMPGPDEEYFELTDLFEAVLAAGATFTFLELGAGYGRWGAMAAAAARLQGKAVRLGFAEAMPKHIGFLHRHMADNDIPPSAYRLYEGALEAQDEPITFCVYYEPDGEQGYGQAAMDWEIGEAFPVVGDINGLPIYQGDGMKLARMPTVRLSTILADFDFVDLADFDIQGSEGRVIADAVDHLTAKVRRLHIETHTPEVEAEMRATLGAAGWVCLRDYSLQAMHETPIGPVWFGGGVQSWLNPRLA